jgi:hypothetical protein
MSNPNWMAAVKSKAAKHKIKLSDLCREAEVDYFTIVRWVHKNPKTLTMAFRVQQALDKMISERMAKEVHDMDEDC